MSRISLGFVILNALLGAHGVAATLTAATESPKTPNYVIVVSQATNDDEPWNQVTTALLEKHTEEHAATVVTFDEKVTESLETLRSMHPEYTCFVAKPEEATREFVAAVHQLTRQLDNDPYTDTMWGILTGYDASNALRIAEHKTPLTVERVASGTDVELDLCKEGVWYCELVKNRMVKKVAGEEPQELVGPDDTTQALVNTLNEYQAQLMVTSGHATQRDWQIGFRYRNGYFRCENGVLYGIDTKQQRYSVHSNNPKVYLPIGNCLMGHIDSRDAMALAWMNSAGVNQMIGYTVPTWYGYGGWGLLDYFLEQPGRFTMSEAFYANQQALLHRLELIKPGLSGMTVREAAEALEATELPMPARQAGIQAGDIRGLLFDRDVVAFYGDPAWEAKMAANECAWEQSLVKDNGRYTFTVEPQRGAESFATLNKNGSQRGGRPFFHRLPGRIGKFKVVAGSDLNPTITDNFILVPHPGTCDPSKTYQVVFETL